MSIDDSELELITHFAKKQMPLPVVSVDSEDNDYKITLDASAVRDDAKTLQFHIATGDTRLELDWRVDLRARECVKMIWDYVAYKNKDASNEDLWMDILPREFERISNETGCALMLSQAQAIRATSVSDAVKMGMLAEK